MNFTKEIRILKSEPFLFITLPASFIILIFLYFIRPILLVRFGLLHSDRIGHFLINTELFFCEQREINNKKKINTLDLFYLPTKPCNTQFSKMLKRNILIFPKIIIRPFCLISRKLKFFSCHITGRPISGDYDIKNLLDKYNTQFNFTHAEVKYGDGQLNKMGIEQNQKIICVALRDSHYLKKKFPNSNFNYHKHRNENIEKFVPTIKFLTKKKYFVVRMGSITKEKLKFKNKNFLDYSKSKHRSDFMDLYIASKCKLFISNNTGIDAFGILFRKPILHIGSIPLGAISTFSNKIFNTVLNHYSEELCRNLNLSEIFQKKLHLGWTNQFFKKKKIVLKKFNSKEILAFVKEVIIFLNNKNFNNYDSYEKKFKKIYCKNIKKHPELKFYHGKFKGHILSNFLKENKNFLR